MKDIEKALRSEEEVAIILQTNKSFGENNVERNDFSTSFYRKFNGR